MFQPRALATATLGSAYFWGVLFLWGGLMIDWRAAVHAPAGDSRS
jgi:hypothetical protein